MKKLLVIIFFLISLVGYSATYYVATNGNDSRTTTQAKNIATPWLTFQKAFNTAVAGDTVYFRGGVYYTTNYVGTSTSGTAANPICFYAYPPDFATGNIPIVDGINKTEPSYGILLDEVDYVYMKGITVRYHFQIEADDNSAFGFYLYNCGNIRLEQCVAHNIGYRGFFISPHRDTIRIINCDAYNIADSLSIGDAGNNGDGFIAYDGNPSYSDTLNYLLFQGCRAWHCSDDGYDVSTEGLIELDSCWAIDCGAYPEYNYGNGFKLGLSAEYDEMDLPARKMQNCIAVYNGGSAVTSNDNNQAAKHMQIYNNTLAFNETLATFYSTTSSDALEYRRIMRNNISYSNDNGVSGGLYTHDHNSWDIPITVTSADFLSIDSTGIRGARQSNGSLPELNFLRLASTSDLIAVGTELGFGTDLGAFQYEDTEVEPVTIYTNSVTVGTTTATTGGNTIDDGGGTITAKGVAYGSGANPTIVGSHTIDGTGTGNFISNISGLIPATTYHVRAYATNEYGTGYGADVEFTTNSESGLSGDFVFSGGKVVTSNNKINVK